MSNKAASVVVIGWRLTGNEPCIEPTIARLTDVVVVPSIDELKSSFLFDPDWLSVSYTSHLRKKIIGIVLSISALRNSVGVYPQHAFCVTCDLTHWGRAMHICVTNICHHKFRWTNAVSLWIWLLATNISEIVFEIQTFLMKKMHMNMSSGPQCVNH